MEDTHAAKAIACRAYVGDNPDQSQSVVREYRKTLVEPDKETAGLKNDTALVDDARTVDEGYAIVYFRFFDRVRRVGVDDVGVERQERREILSVSDDVSSLSKARRIDSNSCIISGWQTAREKVEDFRSIVKQTSDAIEIFRMVRSVELTSTSTRATKEPETVDEFSTGEAGNGQWRRGEVRVVVFNALMKG